MRNALRIAKLSLQGLLCLHFLCTPLNATAEPMPLFVGASELADNSDLPLVVKTGAGYDNALAMNVHNAPVADLRQQLEDALGLHLNFLRAWNPSGEAHVTIITPPEFVHILRAHITMAEIAAIAEQHHIQQARLKVVGLGSGSAAIQGQKEEAFFLMVEAPELIALRQAIDEVFRRNGGRGWDPTHYYPHITVGFTRTDLHEQDGVLKDPQHSLDPRFALFPK